MGLLMAQKTPQHIINAISYAIIKIRIDKGMTQEAIANEVGVSQGRWSAWEKGTHVPDVALPPNLHLVSPF